MEELKVIRHSRAKKAQQDIGNKTSIVIDAIKFIISITSWKVGQVFINRSIAVIIYKEHKNNLLPRPLISLLRFTLWG